MQARVWFVLDEDVTSPELLARCEALLSPAELAEEQRFVFDDDRRRHRITRALVRRVLSEVAPAVGPRDWSFVTGPRGRPEVHPDHGLPWLRFNVSHTPGAVVLAVVEHGLAVGIDVENRSRPGPTTEIAERYFSPAEVSALRALPPSPSSAQRDRFFDLWTLKEAYIKARGLGLSLPLDSFSFSLAGERIALRCDPACNDDAARWAFAACSLTPSHALAVALEKTPAQRARDAEALELALLRTTPLG